MVKDRKRFIAGAICPACSSLDRIFVYSDKHVKIQQCWACGHKEKKVMRSHTVDASTVSAVDAMHEKQRVIDRSHPIRVHDVRIIPFDDT